MPRVPTVTIVKASGERVPFDERKVEASCRRAGASVRLARVTARFVASRIRDGMSTHEVLAFANRCLTRESPRAAIRYSLKDAMRRLGPDGFEFEKFVAAVLRAYGYDATLPDLLPGMNVLHEVDVVARKDGRTVMAECKFRNEAGLYVRLKDVMATWARFLDLREARAAGKGTPALDAAWVVTNTKVTGDGTAFGEGKGMQFMGWRYPKDRGLERMIEERHLYPITVLPRLDRASQERLVATGILLCHDLTAASAADIARRTGLPAARISAFQRTVTDVLQC